MVSEKNDQRVNAIIKEIRGLALEYQRITGKPIGVTGEIGEYEAARLLGLELQDARTAGFDAIRNKGGIEDNS